MNEDEVEKKRMSSEEYINNVLKTESNDFNAIADRFSDKYRNIRLLHGIMGMSTEANEMLDHMKKVIFYGKELDETNLMEEIGDTFWYIGIICHELYISFEDIWEKNIAKLKARYGDKFNESGALERDLDKERKILEGKQDGKETKD